MSIEHSADAATYHLVNEHDALEFAKAGEYNAVEHGIDPYKASLFRLACSEIAMNAVRHGQGGEAVFYLTENQLGIAAEIIDQGPGINNLEKAKADGFSTYGSLGLGLGVAQRSTDRMHLNSNEHGTQIRLEQYPETPRATVDRAQWSFPSEDQLEPVSDIQIRDFAGDGLLLEFATGPAPQDLRMSRQTDPFETSNAIFQSRFMDSTERHSAALVLRLYNNQIDCVTNGEFKIYCSKQSGWQTCQPDQRIEQLIITCPATPTLKLSTLPLNASSYDVGRSIIQQLQQLACPIALAVLTLNRDLCKKPTFSFESN